jgi:ribosomal protein L14
MSPGLGGSGSEFYNAPDGTTETKWAWMIPPRLTPGSPAHIQVMSKSNNGGGSSDAIAIVAPQEFGLTPSSPTQIIAAVPPGMPGSKTATQSYTFNPTRNFVNGEKFELSIQFGCANFKYGYTGHASNCGEIATAHDAAVNEVRVAAVQPDVVVHRAGTPADEVHVVCKDMVLQKGDEIACDPEGSVTLQFADNSTVVVKNTTQLKIASFFTEGGVVKTEILLKMGEVAAKVHKSEATKSDFRIKSPTGTASVRDTAFSVFYDPGSKAMLTTVTEGVVRVDPVKHGLPTVRVPAGKEVEVTASSISKVVPKGRAGARGGVNRRDALARVLKVVAKANRPCGISTPRSNAFAVKPVFGGWAVTIKVIGKRKGAAMWTVKGRRITPSNTLAKRLTRSCR